MRLLIKSCITLLIFFSITVFARAQETFTLLPNCNLIGQTRPAFSITFERIIEEDALTFEHIKEDEGSKGFEYRAKALLRLRNNTNCSIVVETSRGLGSNGTITTVKPHSDTIDGAASFSKGSVFRRMPPTQIRTSYDRRLCLSLVSCMHTPESALYSLAKVIV